MAIISFHLRNPKAVKPTPVFMSLYADNQQTKIKTGLRIEPKQWDVEGQKCKTRGKGLLQTNGQTNTDLAGMATRAIAFYGARRAVGRIPTGAEIWEAIKPVGSPEADLAPDLLADFEQYLSYLKPTRAPNTIKAKRTTYNHLAAYIKHTGRPLTYTDIDRVFRDGFTAYLSSVAGVADNTLAKQLTILKSFLNYATEHGRTPRVDITGWAWKFKEPDILPLTAAELVAVEGLTDLPDYLQNARDLFLLMCYTGLRYSDAVRLKPEYDKGDYLELTATKTDDALTIYIRRSLRPILARYWAGQIHLSPNRSLNRQIKVLARLAGINAPTEVVRYYSQTSRTVKETYQKYELVGCHTARRTYVTLSIELDAPADVVMQATGHKNHRTLQRYNKTTPSRQVAAMRKALGEEGE
ncbi:MAG: hypothetical protein JWP58_1780 [Hymenobacter sp.]|nr:hypothetical protein [Hymenobacter sp.]